MLRLVVIAVVVLLSGCGGDESFCRRGRSAFADEAHGTVGDPSHPFGDPRRAANGVRGGGELAGSDDVFSLDQSPDRSIVLGWSSGRVCDGPGPDLMIAENPFRREDEERTPYFEPMIVAVSADGVAYAELPHRYVGPPPRPGERFSRAARLAGNWVGFAGMMPVLYHEEHNGPAQGVDPFDTPRAGGDVFDLAALGGSAAAERVRREGFRFLKLTAAEHEGRFPRVRGGSADVDGAYARYFIGERKNHGKR